jgi:6-phosphogluconolactonase
VINELNSTVTAFAYEDGALEETQTIGTLPDGFDGDNFPADIRVSSDGRFVYGSNRGHDSIVVFGIDPDSGMLSPVQHEGTGGEWPRNFALDPTGRFLLAANQRTNNIVVFSIDSESGRLTPTGQTLEIPSPVCVRFLV